jgi:hypothetical protein
MSDSCPPDIVEFGERHGIPEFAKATWHAGYAQAMKDCQLAQALVERANQRLNGHVDKLATVHTKAEAFYAASKRLKQLQSPVYYLSLAYQEASILVEKARQDLFFALDDYTRWENTASG